MISSPFYCIILTIAKQVIKEFISKARHPHPCPLPSPHSGGFAGEKRERGLKNRPSLEGRG